MKNFFGNIRDFQNKMKFEKTNSNVIQKKKMFKM